MVSDASTGETGERSRRAVVTVARTTVFATAIATALCPPTTFAQSALSGSSYQDTSPGGSNQTDQFGQPDPTYDGATGNGATLPDGSMDPAASARNQALSQPLLLPEDGVADPAEEDFGRQNLRIAPIDENRTALAPDADPTGIHLGTVILRPTITQSLQYESIKTGRTKESGLYSDTSLKGTLTSDWSRHELLIEGEGTFERLLSGEGDEGSGVAIDGTLRLDINKETVARITGGYDFSREDPDADDAIPNAETQYGVHNFHGGIELERTLGRLRGTVGVNASRWTYTDATLNDGSSLSLSDRDRTLGEVKARIGYEISPALIPFLEASTGKIVYDQEIDRSGYRRSADVYGGRAGVEVDLGNKAGGEFALGYARQRFDDVRLPDLDAFTVDGSVRWSPRYGTDLALGLRTSLNPSSSAGINGSVDYETTVKLTQQVRERLVADLVGATTWTKYPDLRDSDSVEYAVDAKLTYELNRYFGLTAGVGYEYLDRESGTDSETVRAMVGVSAKR